MNTIKEDFEMDLKDWLHDNPESSEEAFADLRIDALEQEEELTEWECEMLDFLYENYSNNVGIKKGDII